MIKKQSKTKNSSKNRVSRRNKIQKGGVLKEYFGGKRKTKRSKAKKGSKKRVSRTNKTQAGGTQTLIDAVVRNDKDMVTNILKTGVDVNYTNNNGVTPLIVACRNGNLYIVILLLDHGATVTTPNSNLNALKEAAISGHIHVVNELLDRGANPGWVDMFGKGIVERVKNNPEMVDLLIRKGILNEYTKEDARRDGVFEQYNQIIMERKATSSLVRQVKPVLPLEIADVIGEYIGGKRKTKRVSRRNKIQEGRDDETEDDMLAKINKIYEHGDIEELNKADDKGKTLLHRASEKGIITVVGELIQYAIVDVNIQDKKGKTALHYASENGHWEVVKELLTDNNIVVNIKDKKGKTPLHYDYNDTVVRGLLEKGGDLTIPDKARKTPMDYKKERDTIRRLLTPGSSINAPPHDENDALLHRHPRRFTLTRPDSRK
jgi:serine/threonine-protein phosphatase 6 regulatory ankyrin repeat subunit B